MYRKRGPNLIVEEVAEIERQREYERNLSKREIYTSLLALMHQFPTSIKTEDKNIFYLKIKNRTEHGDLNFPLNINLGLT